MKFINALLAAFAFSAVSFAQKATIAQPKNGANVPIGGRVTIRVETDQVRFIDSPDGKVTHLGIVLDISTKSDTNQNITQILYKGRYNPKAPNASSKQTEDFTVKIPIDFKAGQAVLRSYHLAAVEVETLDNVVYDTSSVNINVVPA
ncbi:hypothetical protein Moror_12284 [Moniliophthora roreri MCA 2997]|uniref:Uncharacterized protein n=2 Tax=Moniliophthora roreri TaxID=221103 RepID=V2WMK7_MONRO|nr:hypothetical protein Moror_12284 [Moniliophthora roreri MCA 2997]KAI3606397.1 hypothetical protein WG66_009599 [Moniliophthora roreri]